MCWGRAGEVASVLGHGVEVTARGPQHTCSGPIPEERKSTSEHGLHAFIIGEMTAQVSGTCDARVRQERRQAESGISSL